MALANFDDLKASITTWMTRSDMAGFAEDFITLAEARLNRELGVVEVSSSLLGVVGSRLIDITSLSMVEPISLFVTDTVTGDERELVQKQVGTVAFTYTDGLPRFWGINGDNIEFECELDEAYPFRFRHSQRFALSDTAPTNWLLTYHPDIYLSACLIWGNILKRSSNDALPYLQVLETGLPEVGHVLSQSKRGELTVNNALASIGRRSGWNYYS